MYCEANQQLEWTLDRLEDVRGKQARWHGWFEALFPANMGYSCLVFSVIKLNRSCQSYPYSFLLSYSIPDSSRQVTEKLLLLFTPRLVALLPLVSFLLPYIY